MSSVDLYYLIRGGYLPDNQVRFIATFVSFVDLMKFGYILQTSPKKRTLDPLAISSKTFQ